MPPLRPSGSLDTRPQPEYHDFVRGGQFRAGGSGFGTLPPSGKECVLYKGGKNEVQNVNDRQGRRLPGLRADHAVLPGLDLGPAEHAYGSGAALTAREYGAALAGNLLLTWLARSVEKGVVRTAIVWNLFVYDAIGFVATLVLLVAKVLNPLGWGIAAVYLFFTAGFGYFALHREKAV